MTQSGFLCWQTLFWLRLKGNSPNKSDEGDVAGDKVAELSQSEPDLQQSLTRSLNQDYISAFQGVYKK